MPTTASRAATVVLDIGKTNAKLALVDPETRTIIELRTRPNEVQRDGLYPHFDTDGLWAWIVAGLRRSKARNVMFTAWQAMSPRAPVPKSHQPRQANG